MDFIDTHTHIYLREFDSDRLEVIEKALKNSVIKMILPNIDGSTTESLFLIKALFPDVIFPAIGLHPCSVKPGYERELLILKDLIQRPDVVAIGETGLDLYWDASTLPMQIESLKIQINWAIQYNKPVILHVRNAFDEIFSVLDECYKPGLRGVFHCFSGNSVQAQQALSYNGFMLGIGGVVTYKNSELMRILPDLPGNRIVLETDSPYLPPVPYRGQRNEPSYLVQVARAVAMAWNVPVDEVARITTLNARKLFAI